jgi:hypothetical protein
MRDDVLRITFEISTNHSIAAFAIWTDLIGHSFFSFELVQIREMGLVKYFKFVSQLNF